MPKELTEEITNEVLAALEEVGYETDAETVKAVLEHHRSNPLPDNAALSGSILYELQLRHIQI